MGAIAVAYTAAQAADRSFTLVRRHGRALKVLKITGLMPLLSGRPETPPAERSAGPAPVSLDRQRVVPNLTEQNT